MSASTAPRVLFIGGTPRGSRVFDLLLDRNVNICAMYVMEEDAHETNRWSDDMLATAAKNGITATRSKKLTDEDVRLITTEYQPDLLLTVGWRTMIPESVYTFPRLGSYVSHDSPLPRYRGFAPVNWAVINGEPEWGVGLICMEGAVDAGDVIALEKFPVPERATAPELYELVSDATYTVVDSSIDALLAGTATRKPQDHANASYACARTPVDGEIDFTGPTVVADRLIRGLTHPYPGAWTTWKGQHLIVWSAEPVADAPAYEGRIPGRPVAIGDGYVDVLTADGMLRLHDVQLDGGDRVPASTVIRSIKGTLGH